MVSLWPYIEGRRSLEEPFCQGKASFALNPRQKTLLKPKPMSSDRGRVGLLRFEGFGIGFCEACSKEYMYCGCQTALKQ